MTPEHDHENRGRVLRRWNALPIEERSRKTAASFAVEILALPTDHLCRALVIGDDDDVSVVVVGVNDAKRVITVEDGDDPASLAERSQAMVDALVAEEQILDRIFAKVAADRAERLSRPPTEEEIARDMAALERRERLQRLREQARRAKTGE